MIFQSLFGNPKVHGRDGSFLLCKCFTVIAENKTKQKQQHTHTHQLEVGEVNNHDKLEATQPQDSLTETPSPTYCS